jgi:hypothetical protein
MGENSWDGDSVQDLYVVRHRDWVEVCGANYKESCQKILRACWTEISEDGAASNEVDRS